MAPDLLPARLGGDVAKLQRSGAAAVSFPLLPPAFQLVVVDAAVDAFERARRMAPRGLDDGTVYWTDRGDRLRLAVALEPEAPLPETLLAAYVLMVATGDALGALLPPALPVAFAWPDGIVLDGARAGQVRLAVPTTAGADAVPPWLLLGLDLAIGPLAHEPGTAPDVTTLADEGAGDLTAVQLAESITRHLLHWTHRWQEEGFARVRMAWNERCFQRRQQASLVLAAGRFEGTVAGLDEKGRFRIGDTVLPLETALPELG
jgi:BirA family biotin operon repressor/biotin-[acetyl-CoA-carboxylase] ligase